jgi:hypothetical protein
MSNYGVLVVECDDSYQILGTADSRGEALEMASNYISVATPEDGCVPPDTFIVNRRDGNGFFTVREHLSDDDVNQAHKLLAAIRRIEKSRSPLGFGVDALAQIENLKARLVVLGGAR